MRKDVSITIFYGSYFTWLLIYTTLAPREIYLNYFTFAISIFYFIFLRERWDDILWFIATVGFAFWLKPELFAQVSSTITFDAIMLTPIWLPLGWAITVVALRKLFLSIYARN